jgi:hypothetical protein
MGRQFADQQGSGVIASIKSLFGGRLDGLRVRLPLLMPGERPVDAEEARTATLALTCGG